MILVAPEADAPEISTVCINWAKRPADRPYRSAGGDQPPWMVSPDPIPRFVPGNPGLSSGSPRRGSDRTVNPDEKCAHRRPGVRKRIQPAVPDRPHRGGLPGRRIRIVISNNPDAFARSAAEARAIPAAVIRHAIIRSGNPSTGNWRRSSSPLTWTCRHGRFHANPVILFSSGNSPPDHEHPPGTAPAFPGFTSSARQSHCAKFSGLHGPFRR